MKKALWLAFVLALVFVLALSACDKGTDQPQQNLETDNPQQPSTDIAECQHTFSEWITVKEATCVEDGEAKRICSQCSAEEKKTIDKTNTHTEVVDSAISPTCTETGLTEGKYCSRCHEALVAQTTVGALGHVEVIDPAVAATCTEDGKTEGKNCSRCNKTLVVQTTVGALGHVEVIDPAVAATCTEDGKTEGKHCSRCNETLVAQTTVGTLGHVEVIDPAVAATCTEDGKTEGKHCSRCNETLVAQAVVPKTEDHTPVTDAAVAATCKDTGLTEGSHCAVCSKVLVKQAVVPVTNKHSLSNWIIDSQATCKAEGQKHKECTVCEKILESEKIEKSATHTALKNNVELQSGSFCGDAGQCFISVTCTDCGEMISSGNQDIPEKHSMKNGACQVCGLPQSTTAGIHFGLNPDKKSYYAMGIFGANSPRGEVVIGVYNDLSVTEVDLVGCDKITSVVIGDCVETIGSFEGCFSLTTVTIGNRIKEIPAYAFRYCSNLFSITIGDGVEKIGENAFSDCSNLFYAYISGSHDWTCFGNTIYGNWIGKEGGMEHHFVNYLKRYPWEWYRK